MKAAAVLLWIAGVSLLCVGGWALFTEEGLWGYPYFRVVGVTTIIAAPLYITASYLFHKARRQQAR